MKKIILSTSLLLAALLLLALPQLNKKEKLVNKEINLAISSSNNYQSAAYSDAKASVHVVISKLGVSRHTVVLDKTYQALPLSKVPTTDNAITNRIVVPNVRSNKEKLVINYTVVYDSRGSILELSKGVIASEQKSAEQINITI